MRLGCGVAGLTAALSCAYHGKTVDIFERAENVESAIGGGLGLNGGLLGLTKTRFYENYLRRILFVTSLISYNSAHHHLCRIAIVKVKP